MTGRRKFNKRFNEATVFYSIVFRGHSVEEWAEALHKHPTTIRRLMRPYVRAHGYQAKVVRIEDLRRHCQAMIKAGRFELA